MQARGEEPQRFLGGVGKFLAAGDGRQTEQGERGDGIAGRLGPVVIILAAQDQVLAGAGAVVKAAVRRVVKFGQHRLGQGDGEIQVAPARAWPRKDPGRRRRGWRSRRAIAPNRVPPRASDGAGSALLVPQFVAQKGQIFFGGGAEGFIAQHGGGAGQRSEHHPVPGGEHFVVQMRADAPAARLEHFLRGRGQEVLPGGRQVRVRDAQDVLVGQRIGIAVVDEIALFASRRNSARRPGIPPVSTIAIARPPSSSRTCPPSLRCRRLRRSRSRRRDRSCRAGRSGGCRGRCGRGAVCR